MCFSGSLRRCVRYISIDKSTVRYSSNSFRTRAFDHYTEHTGTRAMSFSSAPSERISSDLLGAVGILQPLGLNARDPNIAAFERAFPKVNRPILKWKLPEAPLRVGFFDDPAA